MLSCSLVSFQKEFCRIFNVRITSLGLLLNNTNVITGLKERTEVLYLHHIIEEVNEILKRDLTVVQLLQQVLLPSLVAPRCLWHLLHSRSRWVLSQLLLRTSKSRVLLHLTLHPCLRILGSAALHLPQLAWRLIICFGCLGYLLGYVMTLFSLELFLEVDKKYAFDQVLIDLHLSVLVL